MEREVGRPYKLYLVEDLNVKVVQRLSLQLTMLSFALPVFSFLLRQVSFVVNCLSFTIFCVYAVKSEVSKSLRYPIDSRGF